MSFNEAKISTGPWLPIPDEYIPTPDLETSDLHVRTNSHGGSGDIISFFFIDEAGIWVGGISLFFTSPPQWGLPACSYKFDIPASLPAELDKDWAFAKRGNMVTVYCNGEKVGVLEANSEYCQDREFRDTWDQHWSLKASQLFFLYDSASDAYYIG